MNKQINKLNKINGIENFDNTYHNYGDHAFNYYRTRIPVKNVHQADRILEYRGYIPNIMGNNVYDHIYDQIIRKNNWNLNETVNDMNDPYDTKFMILDGQNNLARYSLNGMYDPHPFYREFEGHKIVLAQKQF